MSQADARSPHTDALGSLGFFIDDNAKRDAIHLAVLPVIAGEKLFPGDPIIIRDDRAYSATTRAEATGIVDPFLPTVVNVGYRFWFIVMPRTITSLRHVWDHPDFPPE